MKRNWPSVVAVALLAAGIVFYRHDQATSHSHLTPNVMLPSAKGEPAVLFFVDPREIGEAGGCGAILRMERAAAARGLAVREVPPGSDPATEKRYAVTVTPTVIFLDGRGQSTRRLEGEAPATIEAIRSELTRLERAGR